MACSVATVERKNFSVSETSFVAISGPAAIETTDSNPMRCAPLFGAVKRKLRKWAAV